MNILFCIHDFQEKNLKLQPWLSFHMMGQEFSRSGHRVSVLTDCNVSVSLPGIRVYCAESLRAANSDKLLETIGKISPDIIVFSVTPLSLLTSNWISKIRHAAVFAFLSYSFYSFCEIFKALPHLNKYDRWAYGRHLLVPQFAWRHFLLKNYLAVFCQSNRTCKRINRRSGKKIPVHVVLPGIDKGAWFPKTCAVKMTKETVFLYTGSPRKIRGFDIILKAFSRLPYEDIRLRILARGADRTAVKDITQKLEKMGVHRRAEVVGGWLSKEDIREQIRRSAVVLLPFVLVPSELPVTVMEVIACGVPVIVSDIDGLPEAAGDCGLVVHQADAGHLASAMERFHSNRSLRDNMVRHCSVKYEAMESWESMAEKWMAVFEG